MGKNNQPSISVFFPFLNDWGTVGSLVSLAIATAQKLTDDWEVIIINDGSNIKDRLALGSIVDLLSSKFKDSPRFGEGGQSSILNGKIRIIDHEKNWGYGGALIDGFAHATKDLIFYTDCDAQYDPRELELLYNKMISASTKASAEKIGMVNGYKIKRNDPWFRIVAGRMYHYFVKFAFGLPIRDTDCDFRLIRREVFNTVKLFETTGTICTELVKKIDHFGYQIVEVPVHHFWRTSGKSQFFNFRRLGKTAFNLGKLWYKLMIQGNYTSRS